MKKFFETTDSWINKFSCTGLLIEFSREAPEVIIQEYGTEIQITTKNEKIEPYFPDDVHGRVFKITLYAPTCDPTNVIDIIPRIIKGVNWKRNKYNPAIGDLSSEEENWLGSCIWKTFEERD